MSPQFRPWLGIGGLLVVVGVSLGWWTFQVVRVPPLQAKPSTSSTQSPLSSPVVQTLKGRTIYGEIPVADPGSSDRADPFVR